MAKSLAIAHAMKKKKKKMAEGGETSTTGNKTKTGGSNPGGASTGGAGTVTITTGKIPPKGINISNVGGKTDSKNAGGMDPGDEKDEKMAKGGEAASKSGYGSRSQDFQEGVHSQSAQGSIGTSTAGRLVRRGMPERSKAVHRENLKQMKSMKKPKLYADGGGAEDSPPEPNRKNAEDFEKGTRQSAGTTLAKGWDNMKKELGMAEGGEVDDEQEKRKRQQQQRDAMSQQSGGRDVNLASSQNNTSLYAEGGQITDNYQTPGNPHSDGGNVCPNCSHPISHPGNDVKPGHPHAEMNQAGDDEGAGDMNSNDPFVMKIMMGRAKGYSEGGKVANTDLPTADFMPAEYDDLHLRDDLESTYGDDNNSGDASGNEQEDEDRHDIVKKIMKSRAKKDKLPRPA